jgi:hypothetical protein
MDVKMDAQDELPDEKRDHREIDAGGHANDDDLRDRLRTEDRKVAWMETD